MPCCIPEEQSEFSDCKFSHLVSAQAALLVQAVTVNIFFKYGSFFFFLALKTCHPIIIQPLLLYFQLGLHLLPVLSPQLLQSICTAVFLVSLKLKAR